jgi:outer membrane murein-binding lipoprotein Lpp
MPIRQIAATLALSSLALAGCARSPAGPGAMETRKETSMSQTRDDQARVAQLTLDLEALQPFLHPEVAGRKPVLVLKNEAMAGEPGLSKFGEPVRYVTRAEAGGRPWFEITALKVEGETARAEFSYPVEGVDGRVELRKSAGAWKIESHSIREK